MRHAALRSYVPEIAQVATVLLGDLQEAHYDLLEQMAAMEAITSQPGYDSGRLASGRWKISQASLARRILASRICDYLVPRVEADLIAAIKSLQEADRALLQESARYISQWRAEHIEQNWRGYCRASREMRRRMHQHIALEQKVLYGILERAVQFGE